MNRTELIKCIANSPHEPGVYKMFDDSSNIIYIGKAKNLYRRLHDYAAADNSQKTKRMIFFAKHVEWMTTSSEIEALFLEAKLIAQHKPRYNILLKEHKGFFYIKFSKHQFPKIYISHTPNDNENTLGPFFSFK